MSKFTKPYIDHDTNINVTNADEHDFLQHIKSMNVAEIAAEHTKHNDRKSADGVYRHSKLSVFKDHALDICGGIAKVDFLNSDVEEDGSLVGSIIGFTDWYRNMIRIHMIDTIIIDTYRKVGGKLF